MSQLIGELKKLAYKSLSLSRESLTDKGNTKPLAKGRNANRGQQI